MVSRHLGRWATTLALVWAAGDLARADAIIPTGTAVAPIFTTGNVETDMPSTSSSVTVVPGHPLSYTAQPQWMTDAGLINGYAMKDIRLSYNKATDTLDVGVNFYGVAGDTDGSPDGQTNPKTIAMNGSNPAHLGADKSITLAFAPVNSAGGTSTPVIVAGVPAVKPTTPTGTTDDFTVAAYQASTGGLTHSYGQTLTANTGNLAYDPSTAHPGFEFTITNFSKIPGLNALTNGFYLSAYAGSQQTIIVGKSDIASTFVKPTLDSPQALQPANNLPATGMNPVVPPSAPEPILVPPAVHTPEPTTILAWGMIVGGAAWRLRRRRQHEQA